MHSLGKKPSSEVIESERKKLLRVYFDALSQKGYETEGEKPWEMKQ